MKQQNKAFAAQLFGRWALEALIFEASLYPKPGLVDPKSNGAHTDMNYQTFRQSCDALAPFLIDYTQIGLNHKGTATQLFEKVRKHGQLAETAMLAQTNGINTHKGANFSFALLLSAAGKVIQEEQFSIPFSDKETTKILAYVKAMTTNLVQTDFTDLSNKKTLSYGEKLFLNHGITGIRGEAAAGYPALHQLALPFLRTQRQKDQRMTFLLLLLKLMATIEDANVINRGGIDAWQNVKKQSGDLLNHFSITRSSQQLERALTNFDQVLIKDHLSPGGSADLLALSFFFAKLEGLI